VEEVVGGERLACFSPSKEAQTAGRGDNAYDRARGTYSNANSSPTSTGVKARLKMATWSIAPL
jgi:hypothetical protein